MPLYVKDLQTYWDKDLLTMMCPRGQGLVVVVKAKRHCGLGLGLHDESLGLVLVF